MDHSSPVHFGHHHFFPIIPIYLLVVITAGAPSHTFHGPTTIGFPPAANQIPPRIAHALLSNFLTNQHFSSQLHSILISTSGSKIGLPNRNGSGQQQASRKRKSVGSLSRIYEGLLKGPKGEGQRSKTSKLTQQQQQQQQRYATRSGNRSHEYHSFPSSTSSAEYFVSEFRRLFATQPTPRRPYAMRLRWG